jgi:hypothetical protein
MYGEERGEGSFPETELPPRMSSRKLRLAVCNALQAFLSPFHSLHYFFQATYLLVNPT